MSNTYANNMQTNQTETLLLSSNFNFALGSIEMAQTLQEHFFFG